MMIYTWLQKQDIETMSRFMLAVQKDCLFDWEPSLLLRLNYVGMINDPVAGYPHVTEVLRSTMEVPNDAE